MSSNGNHLIPFLVVKSQIAEATFERMNWDMFITHSCDILKSYLDFVGVVEDDFDKHLWQDTRPPIFKRHLWNDEWELL